METLVERSCIKGGSRSSVEVESWMFLPELEEQNPKDLVDCCTTKRSSSSYVDETTMMQDAAIASGTHSKDFNYSRRGNGGL
jgi:hypothetical protein